jgi:ligand-binding SRPBCC domain-containing protein
MPTFVRSVMIHAPVDTVFRFHVREDALRLLSPAFPRTRLIRKTGGLEIGSRAPMDSPPRI